MGKVSWGESNFWQLTNQPDWSSQVGSDSGNPGGGWCICMWATASLIRQVGCDNVHLDCDSSDVSYVMKSYSDGGVALAPAKECIQRKCPQPAAAKATPVNSADSVNPSAAVPTSLSVDSMGNTSPDNGSAQEDDDSLSAGAIIGIVIGGIAAVALAVAAA